MKKKLKIQKTTYSAGTCCEDCGRLLVSPYKAIRGKVAVWLCWACFNQEEE